VIKMRVRVQSHEGTSVVRWALRTLRIALIVAGVCFLSIFAWLQFEHYYFEARYLKEFERMAAAVRQARPPEPSLPSPPTAVPPPVIQEPLPLEGARENAAPENPLLSGDMRVLARLRVSRVGLEVAVLEGIEDRTLRRGAGWIPGTARPGEQGNVGIAAHRDTFFRPLREVRSGDRIELETLSTTQSYVVRSVYVVEPKATSVLQPTGEPTVTLVTCFPFNYVGPAPRRYIVQAVADGMPRLAVSAGADF
jgi:LPXTG-site transpeptidase (sortase) family protein